VVTYFYRGRFGSASPQEARTSSPDLSGAAVVAGFRAPNAARWAFGRLTGDYNGIHMWDGYARRFGFPASFMHPQRAVGLCLAHLKVEDAEQQSLTVWVNGPAFYGAEVALVGSGNRHDRWFGLSVAGDSRQAIAGAWRSGAA
jgi:hypothetical protein